jgi:ABC-type antimicrobial peptide transport system permease subunit
MGATSNRVVKQIVMEGLQVASGGLILAWLMAAIVQLHLFTAGPGAWTVLIAVPALLFAVAGFACWLPARRATLVDPVVALRAE